MKKIKKILSRLLFIWIIALLLTGCNKNAKVEEDYKVIANVGSTLKEVYEDSNYSDYSVNEKKEAFKKVLDELESTKQIKDVRYVSSTSMYEFKYSNGILGGVMLEKFDENYSGHANGYKNFYEEGTHITNTVKFDSTAYPYNEKSLDAKVLYGLGQDYTIKELRERNANWEREYLNTEMDENVTIRDFKTGLEGYDIISIEEHGTLYDNEPIISTEEIVTESNMKEYKEDIYNGNLLIVNYNGDDSETYYYCVRPSFFSSNYKKNELDGAIVFLGCCEGYKNDKLVKALEKAGADTVIGYTDTVYTMYNVRLQDAFIYSLLSGDNVEDALDYAMSMWGYYDNQWAKLFLEYDSTKVSAYPKLYGSTTKKLVTLAENEPSITNSQAINMGEQLYNKAWQYYFGQVECSDNLYQGQYYEVQNMNEVENTFTDNGFKQFISNNDFIEKIGNKYYRIDADRGSDLGYLGHDLEVKKISDNQIEFNAIEKYVKYDSDYGLSESQVKDYKTKTNRFVIKKEEGVWKVEDYTLPN